MTWIPMKFVVIKTTFVYEKNLTRRGKATFQRESILRTRKQLSAYEA